MTAMTIQTKASQIAPIIIDRGREMRHLGIWQMGQRKSKGFSPGKGNKEQINFYDHFFQEETCEPGKKDISDG